MERGQRAPDPERLGDLVTADRTSAGSQDRAVSRTAYAVGQRGQRRKVRVRFIGGHHAVIVLLTGIGSTRVTGRSAAALRVVGVELSADLCRQACKNVERLRDRRAPNTVENVLADKYDYADTTRPVAVRPVRNAILRSALERIVGGTRGRSLRSPTPTRHTTRCSREQPGAGRFRWRIEMSVRRRHPQCGVRMRRPMAALRSAGDRDRPDPFGPGVPPAGPGPRARTDRPQHAARFDHRSGSPGHPPPPPRCPRWPRPASTVPRSRCIGRRSLQVAP